MTSRGSPDWTNRPSCYRSNPPSASVGDFYDNNALAYPSDGYTGPDSPGPKTWRDLNRLDYATPERIDWFNHRRLLKPIGHIPTSKRRNYHPEHIPALLAGVARNTPRPAGRLKTKCQ